MTDFLVVAVPTVLLILIPTVLILRDPRRMRCAMSLGFSLSVLALALMSFGFAWLSTLSEAEVPYFLLGLIGFGFLLILALAIFLIWAGVVLLQREGLSAAHSLSLILGLAILGFAVAMTITVLGGAPEFFIYLFLLMFPAALFGFVLFSYLLYSGLYGFWAKRFARPGAVVVVLGSGLIGDRVPPLLARRIDLGLEMYRKSLKRWPAPLLVMSGGKGDDEAIAEAEGMGRYVLDQGLPELEGKRSELLLETSSASTEQNLAFTKDLMLRRDFEGPWMAVTSDFHAFRAALLMSRAGLKGNAVGARSVRYFWASAKLREFVAILASVPKWSVTLTILSMAPFAFAVGIRLLSLLGVVSG